MAAAKRTPRAAASTKRLLDRMHSFVEGEAITAQQVRVLASAVCGWVAELQERVGATDRRSALHVHGLLDALTSTAERLSTLAGQLVENLAALSERDEDGNRAEPVA